ncbi:MAG TPA: ABC transporter substrate-binding protein, partial [Gammaproteobacteria bacterium]|nr:ABC transporter substrate-binding protein [Gammaproteobacteria bacterium]
MKPLVLMLFNLLIFTATPLHAQSQSALVEGARKEGKLAWYTSMAIDTSKPLLDAFQKEYPFVKSELVRAGEEQLMNRVLSEIRAGRWAFDAISTSAISVLPEKKIVQPYLTPNRDGFLNEFKDPNGYWTGIFVNNLILAYNTRMITAKEAPKDYADLLDPKWKGKMLMDST